MRRFKNILYLADGSKGEKSALTRAANLASANKAKLTIFDSVEVEDRKIFVTETNAVIDALHTTQLQARLKELKSLCKATISKVQYQ